jgi:hypothetical protein
MQTLFQRQYSHHDCWLFHHIAVLYKAREFVAEPRRLLGACAFERNGGYSCAGKVCGLSRSRVADVAERCFLAMSVTALYERMIADIHAITRAHSVWSCEA